MSGQVFIVDDDVDFCASLKWLLESTNVRIKAFNSADAFLRDYDGEPGCLLLDVRMPGMDGIALQQKLLEMNAPLAVVVLTGHASIPVAINAMKQKALDFLEKPFDDTRLLAAIDKALAASKSLHAEKQRSAMVQQGWSSLTAREREIMTLVVQGHSNRDIADSLNISVKTVEIHRARVMVKMEAESLANLVLKSLACADIARAKEKIFD